MKKQTYTRIKKYNISDVNVSYDPMRNAITQMAIYVDSFEKKIAEKRKLQRECKKYANIMAYLGFLSLFCVLILSSAGTVPVLEQEIMTVLAFGVILVTQQINIHSAKKIKKDIEESEAALNAQREVKQDKRCSNQKII